MLKKIFFWFLCIQLIEVILDTSVASASTTCSSGWYFDGNACSKCDDSCKTCSSGTKCDTCEESMYLELTTQLCKFCSDGEYYDYTYSLCRTCGNICSGLCSYQLTCFVCPTGQIYDVDLLSCVDTCSSSKLLITDSLFTLSNVCRNNQIYVDVTSNKIIELGTQNYPYKTIKAALSEITNLYSHKQVNITVYIKESTTAYIEDDTNYILNMTLVKITSYSDTSDSPSKATLVPTQLPQQGLSKRSAFNLLTTTDLRLNQVLKDSLFTSLQQILILRGSTTFVIAMSNFYLDNVDARRESVDLGKSTIFIYPISLGRKYIDIRNTVLNMTGTIFMTSDPLNGYFENIQFDTYRLKDGFYFPISCNYPEANLVNSVYFNNITCFTSSKRTLYSSPRLILYKGPANFTCSNVSVPQYGTSYQDSTITASFASSSTCIPNDGVLQTVDFHNWTLSMPNLPMGSNLLNGISIRSDYSLYRSIASNVTNFNFTDYVPAFGTMILCTGTYTQTIYVSDISLSNFSSLFSLISFYSFKKVIVNRVSFDGCESTSASSFVIAYSLYVEVHNISYNKYTYLENQSVSALMSLLNIQITATIIDNVSVTNSNLHYAKSIYLLNKLNLVSMTNFKFSNISMNQGASMIYSVGVQSMLFSNHSFTNIYSLDDTDDSSSMLNIQSFDLAASSNSSISNIAISNSGVSFLKFNGLANTPTNPCYIMIQNMSYTDSTFKSSKSLIDISNLESSVNLNIVLTYMKFDNISYTSKGNLLLLQQQLPTSLVLSNSTFTNLVAAGITVESSNKVNTALKTQVIIQNSVFNAINDQTNSILTINEGGVVTISNCSFTNIYSYETGAVIYAGFQLSLTTIYNSVFQNNTAATGGLFYIKSQSKIACYNCVFMNNFAISSGIAYAIDSGYFEFYNCSIQNNYALSNPVSLMFNGVTTSKVIMCNISSNYGLTLSDLNIEFNNTCDKLCFVPTLFKKYVQSNPKILNADSSKALFQVISASFLVSNYTNIHNANTLISSFFSNVTISSCMIYNILIVEQSIVVTSSNLIMQNVSISNIDNPNSLNFIEILLGSSIQIISSSFINSNSNLMSIRDSSIVLSSFIFSNISSGVSLISLYGCTQIIFANLTVLNSNTKSAPLFMISSSNNIVLKSISITNIPGTLFSVDTSSVTQINAMNIINCTQALLMSKSWVQVVSNSVFDSNGGSKQKYGGALNIIDSKVVISNSTFSRNTAESGGAINYQCSSFGVCSLVMSKSTFDSNNATSKGGAIYYNYNRPSMQNITFINNRATYGNNIASYAVKIRFEGRPEDLVELNNYTSGSIYPQYKLSLFDYDDQTMVLDNVNQISITPAYRSTTSIKGTSQVVVHAGVSTFDNFILIAKPGSTSIYLNAASRAIDSAKIANVFGPSAFSNLITANFRFCMPGEIKMSDNTCVECAPGSYSLQWNSTLCSNCLSNAQCLGGAQIYVDSGYWRMSSNSTKIAKCTNSNACDGGFVDQTNAPVNCNTGYGGVLCSECQIVNGTKYELVSDNTCSKCPDPAVNTIRVFGLCLLVFLFILFTIVLNIRKTSESQLSILLRILTNYMQLISTSMSFTISYPTTITNMFSVFSNIGSSSTTFLSFDCFITAYEVKGPFPSNKIFKLFLESILPIILFVTFSFIWAALYALIRKWVPDLKRCIVISLITVIFFLHPRLAQSSISIFQCVEIDSSIYR